MRNFLKNEDIICAKKNCLEPKIARRQLRRHIILRIIIITISSFSKLHLFLCTYILALAESASFWPKSSANLILK